MSGAGPIDLQAVVDEVFAYVETYRGHGHVASYIPALAEADTRKLGLAVVLNDGSSFTAGDADEPFPIQSVANVFSLSLALQQVGAILWNHVGREAAGSPYNSLFQLEAQKGKPRNPLMNAGAIVVGDHLIGTDSADVAVNELLDFLRDGAADESLAIDESVAMSESQAGHWNRSLAYFMAAAGNLHHPVEEALSIYFRQCAISMSCTQMARAALYLANDGQHPLTGEAVLTASKCRRILSLMLSCGHYDVSGDFAFRVGLPGKSSTSGAILAIVPRVGAVSVWSPGLTESGISLAGTVALERLVERTGWSIFA